MDRSKHLQARKQPMLFDPVPNRPRWEDLPPEVRQQATQLLRELLLSPAAQELLRQRPPGGNHE
jgi:hypothetical protein